jgi:hypothetical protein
VRLDARLSRTLGKRAKLHCSERQFEIQLAEMRVSFFCAMAILCTAVSCSSQPDAGVVAVTAIGNLAMAAVGMLSDGGEPSVVPSAPQMQNVNRVFGVRVQQEVIPIASVQAWLCREQQSRGCIVIGNVPEVDGESYRITFRNFTIAPSYEKWRDDRSTSQVLVHSHDRAWAIDIASDAIDKGSFFIVVGMPGGQGYAVRLR